jgi:hypothetical protein
MPSQSHAPITDEIDELVAQLDAADLALGLHLVHVLIGAIGNGVRAPRPLSAAWYRARILDWCRAGSAVREFGAQAVRSTEMAVAAMEDDLLVPLGRDLMARALALPEPAAAPVQPGRLRKRRLGR